jgi:acyl-CoA synthetase (AMP-forming)/AMP-acid ligase II
MDSEKSYIALIEQSIKKNWNADALTDYKGATLQFKDVARKIEKIHIILEESGVKKGDKIAICGRNSSNWGVTFLAVVTYGAVIVPILSKSSIVSILLENFLIVTTGPVSDNGGIIALSLDPSLSLASTIGLEASIVLPKGCTIL